MSVAFAAGSRACSGAVRITSLERLLDHGLLADPERKITRNRQPGRCCAQGCAPEAGGLVKAAE
ncbi:MAG: hypothetical protein JO118_17125 [Acetobacteraceae bacterium]|nr:hypothetical protein [Acetobacteraceae bacterium]